jgi:hypothetical protein
VTRLAASIAPLLRRLVARRAQGGGPGAASGLGRRRSARLSLACGSLLFLLLTLALESAAESVRPEWRDPEYGRRLRQLRRWQKERPDRPLVLIAGSSRTQYGVSPAAMEFADRPGVPLVYNFGYRGAHPLGTWLQLSRAFDDGVRPRAVLLQLAGTELRHHGPAETLFLDEVKWGPRLAGADARRLSPFTERPGAFTEALSAARIDPWASRREALVSDLLPEWQPPELREHHDSWEGMDRYGYRPLRLEGERAEAYAKTVAPELERHRAALACPLGDTTARALRLTISRLRADGVAVALFWAPESASYRALYPPGARAAGEEFARQLAREFGVPLFPAPEHLDEADFADGFHLAPVGGPKYSRWLAENHLKPWLAQVLKSPARGREVRGWRD